MFHRLIIKYRFPFIFITHFLLVPLSNYLAFWLRFDGSIPPTYWNLMVRMLPALILLRISTLAAYRLFRGLWRYTSVWDLTKILFATLISSFLFFILTHVILGIIEYPRSVFIFDSILLVFFMGGVRLPWRIYREVTRRSRHGKRVLVYGAGDAGEMIIRDMKQHPDYNYNPVALIDDNASKVGQDIHGVPIVGTRNRLSRIIPELKIDEVILAIPSSDPFVKREVLKCLEPFHIPIKTTPNLRDILDGKVTVSQIRSLAVEDLLERMPVNLDLTPVREMLRSKRVLVTGAGGSIGSELCRQISQMEPAELILVDRYENGLYQIIHELGRESRTQIVPRIADITDKELVSRLFHEHLPEIVFHAAAHKHVPLMETNPCEAVKNNVLGTKILADIAVETGVEKFVLISTDKAVNPTGVMGVSKRVAEMLIQSMPISTSFVTVRFGNVLGSNGSVVPLFMEQIRKGGPVTVTHPQMKRYFMLIPEAVQLVLLAGATASDSEIYTLQMGDQIPITEMARNLIQLSGFVPDVDIPIVFTGMRPGEKMYEELVSEDESAESSGVTEILRIRPLSRLNAESIRRLIDELETAAFDGDRELVLSCFTKLVPTFRSSPEREASVLNTQMGA
jgi:FlaA1/EpsC-like NDP-sugar epimerase